MSGHAIVFLRQGGSYPDKDQGPACMINVQRPEYKTKQGGAKRKQDRNKKKLDGILTSPSAAAVAVV